MKYLIAGLGNIGSEYEFTRHNIGFLVVDELVRAHGGTWTSDRLAMVSEIKYKGRTLVCIKPTTYMNLSGKAVDYWLKKSNLTPESLLVVLDDLNLDYGQLRMRPKGSSGGHNGLKDIEATFGHTDYARLRIGVGDNFRKGNQVDYVLGKWTKEEQKDLPFIVQKSADACASFAAIGMKLTMENFNGKAF